MRGILGIRCRKAEGMKAVIANTHLRSAYDDLYRGLRQRYARHKLGCFAACCDRTTGCQSSHDAINRRFKCVLRCLNLPKPSLSNPFNFALLCPPKYSLS